MKILALGDIHGRNIWKDIYKLEKPDLTIFLGDYVSTHDPYMTSQQQIDVLKDILSFKEENLDKVILLRGNHDLNGLGYNWAICSGEDYLVKQTMMREDFKKRFLSLTQWIYIYNDIVFSHAGVSQVWLDMNNLTLEEINNQEPSDIFGFCPSSLYDINGTSETQPPTWIRPEVLCNCNIEDYDQVVGHTPVRNVCKTFHFTKGKRAIWLCDSLEYGNYLVIEDNTFYPKSLK